MTNTVGKTVLFCVLIASSSSCVIKSEVAQQDSSPGFSIDGPLSWSQISSMNEARMEHTMTRLQDGRVLITGGFGIGPITNALDSVEIWDPATQSFSFAKPMHTRRARHAATLRSNGRVFVTGGYDSTIETAKAEEYDPETGEWTELAAMTVGRMYNAAVELPDGNVLVASGCCDQAYPTAEVYDFNVATFSATSPLEIAHAAPTLTVLPNGQVLIVGNSNLASTGLYNDSLQQWTSAGNLNTPRNEHTATLLSSGHVVVAGGISKIPPTNSVESYDPSQKQWTLGASLRVARRAHTASHLVANGLEDIVWVGGLNNTVLSSCERSLPQPCANLNVARALHRAVVVDVNGQTRILVTGGQGTDNQPTNSAELSTF